MSGFPFHLIFDALAYFLGFWIFTREQQKGDSLPLKNRQLVILGAIGGAYIGSTLLGALEHFSLFLRPPSPLYYLSSKTIVGGLLGGLLGVECIKLFIGEKRSSGDAFVFPLILGMCVGRIGCFLSGVSDMTAGLPSSLPWAIEQGDGVPRHPTSLYEILFLLLLGLLLTLLKDALRPGSGMLFKYFLFSYCLFRLFIDFLKPREPVFLGLSFIQLACSLGILNYLVWHGRQMFAPSLCNFQRARVIPASERIDSIGLS